MCILFYFVLTALDITRVDFLEALFSLTSMHCCLLLYCYLLLDYIVLMLLAAS